MLFFNKTTKSIVMFYREEYYDMRIGKPFIGNMDLIPLRPFEESSIAKIQPITNTKLLGRLDRLPEKYQFSHSGNTISGKFPRYFFKGLNRMLCGKE